MKNSRAKGAHGEREFAASMRELGFTGRRTQQYCGTAGDSDVVIDELPGVHFEVKRVERLNVDAAMGQAVSDCVAGSIPVVAHRRNHKDWLLTLRLSDLDRLVHAVASAARARAFAEMPG